ncbi:MAG: T9SS type A sorting domain-containing protein, partial [Tannerella sp.]|nr:T9SS type A sorting domain-containing protein [Tannerella sp.]
SNDAVINITDFNQDGVPEVYVGNKIYTMIYTSPTLRLLYSGNVSYNIDISGYTAIGDMDGDGKPEIVAGNRIYKVNITNPDLIGGATVTEMTGGYALPASALPSNIVASGGRTQVADFDLDGKLEVLVVTINSSGNPCACLWKPNPGGTAAQLLGSRVFPQTGANGIGSPLVGNIDADKYPEAVFISNGAPDSLMYALKYNPSLAMGSRLVPKWTLRHTDRSGATGMSLFDFDLDGSDEICYRDETTLRIINGSGSTPEIYATFPNVTSGTRIEMPVIADVDGDGQAEIIVNGYTSGYSERGYIRVFKAPRHTRWAPARPVWNQYGYTSLNVHDDLTIPKQPASPALRMAGKNGIAGDADDVFPFNNVFRQQTMLDSLGIPIWLAPDLELLSVAYDYDSGSDSLRISVKFTNAGDATAAWPLCLTAYRNAASPGSVMAVDSFMKAVPPGDTVQAVITVRNYSAFRPSLKNIVVSLNDRGSGFVQAECEYGNNRREDPEANVYGLFHDVQTMQAYRYVEIALLRNDRLPAGALASGFRLLDSVTLQPRNGALMPSGNDSCLIYVNSGVDSLTHHIDSFRYQITFYNDSLGTWQTRQATVYIYIIADTYGGSACYGEPYTATLPSVPPGTTFRWYAGATVADTVYLGSGVSHTFGTMRGDSVRMVKPVTSGTAPWNRAGGFPPGLFTVHAPASSAPAPMRWTGIADNSWHNPANWVQQTQSGNATYETPVSWPPSACTNVDISSDAPFYPELTLAAFCDTVTVRDRALLKNPHALTYRAARVELLLRATERDRFVMWSAPLRDMYSGDYHFKGVDGQPRWGDVAMNFFQQVNPDYPGYPARANLFTATFGFPGDSLPLGRAFNLRVTGTADTRDRPLVFPQTATVYNYIYNQQPQSAGPLVRTRGSRFITDGVQLDAGGRFEMKVFGGAVPDGEMVQVVNPYLAWLHADSFLLGNSGRLVRGYLIWDGRADDSFVAVKFAGDPEYQPGMRYMATRDAGAFSVSPEYIPPLQSFFVVKNPLSADVYTVQMSPRWTTTQLPGAYRLRMSEAGNGVLRIRAVQGSSESSAALHFDKYAAVPEYSGREDVRALFYDANPLAIYVLTPLGEPLAISADGEYHTHTTPLGLRLTQSGEVTLEFSGQEVFGHDVYLVDRAQNREIFLQETPSYTFMAVKPAGVDVLELNDRFVLRMEYTGVHSEAAPQVSSWTAGAVDGAIHIRAVSGTISSLRIYTVAGAAVYSARESGTYFRIPVERGRVYLVHVEVNGAGETKKVIVK